MLYAYFLQSFYVRSTYMLHYDKQNGRHFMVQCYRQIVRKLSIGGVAQMVERSLSMREVPGLIPGASKPFPHFRGLITKFR